MMATHNLSKPLNVFTPQAHKPTILNLHPNIVTILSSSISGGNRQMLRQERLRDHLQPTETMGLSGPDPKVVVTKRPMTRMCMCPNKRVPSERSVKLEFLRGGNPASETLNEARRTPHFLDDAECKFKKILWQRDDRVQFEDLKQRDDQVQFEDLKKYARGMEMIRKEDAAVKELECYISCKCIGSEEIYKAKLLLVEMLIYQGDYGRARQTLVELIRVQPEKDYEPQFYLAIICALLCKEVEAQNLEDEARKFEAEAKSHWNEFKKKFEEYGEPPQVDEPPAGTPKPMVLGFDQFKEHIKVLGQEIDAERYNRAT